MKTLTSSLITAMLLGRGLLLAIHSYGAGPSDPGRISIPATPQAEETFTIDQPGSYCLTGNRYATCTALRISTNNVTLDLNGFCLVGSKTGTNYGILLNGVRDVEIRNGTIMNFGDRGIGGNGHQEGIRVLSVRLIDNGACGLCLDASGLYMKDCYVSGNKMTGICPGVCAMLLNNIVCSNASSGVLAGWGCRVEGNNVYGNQHTGIFANYNSGVENNMLMHNNLSAKMDQAGIVVRAGSLVRNNVLRDNQLTSIRALEGDNQIEGNLVTYSATQNGTTISSKPGMKNEIAGNCCSTNRSPARVNE